MLVNPDPALAPALAARFDAIFTQRTSFATLNQTLKRLHAHKEKLLLVLKRPDIVLHTNGSEGDIRGYVKWRKISCGTRSNLGKRCREGVVNLPTRSQSIPFVQTIPRSTGARHLLPTQEGSQPKLAIVDCGHQVPTQPE